MTELVIVFLAFTVGFLGALLGVGGGIFLMPVLVIGLDFEPLAAMPISLLCALATSITASDFISINPQIIRRALFLEPLALLGTLLFARLAYLIPQKIILCFFALFVLTIAILAKNASLKLVEHSHTRPAQNYFLSSVSSFFAGACAGMFGIGGGVLMVPLLRMLCFVPIKDAVQISLTIMVSTSVVSLVVHAAFKSIAWSFGIYAVAGALPGAFLGRYGRKFISEKSLSDLFTIVSVAMAMIIFIKAFLINDQ